jgi:hypothetical protein
MGLCVLLVLRLQVCAMLLRRKAIKRSGHGVRCSCCTFIKAVSEDENDETCDSPACKHPVDPWLRTLCRNAVNRSILLRIPLQLNRNELSVQPRITCDHSMHVTAIQRLRLLRPDAPINHSTLLASMSVVVCQLNDMPLRGHNLSRCCHGQLS